MKVKSTFGSISAPTVDLEPFVHTPGMEWYGGVFQEQLEDKPLAKEQRKAAIATLFEDSDEDEPLATPAKPKTKAKAKPAKPKASPKTKPAKPKASPKTKAAKPKASPKAKAAKPKASPKAKAAKPKASPKAKRPDNTWMQALREWNGSQSSWCLPKKGTKEYDEVRTIQHRIITELPD